MQRHDTGLGSASDEDEAEHDTGAQVIVFECADIGKRVGTHRCEQAEREQQRQRAEARHHQIEISGGAVVGLFVMGHDERP